MAVGTTAALGAMALGGGMQALGGMQAGRAQRRQQAAIMGRADQQYMGGGGMDEFMFRNQLANLQGPGQLSTQGIDLSFLQGLPGMNAGNDALMQMLRSDPMRQMDSGTNAQLHQILQTGSPFDTSQAFQQLGAMDQRQTAGALANFRGGATSLGQRFGSAQRRGEADLLANISAQLGTRNAGLLQGSHEAAQARRLEAAGLLTNREQMSFGNQFQAAQALNQGALGLAGLQLQGRQFNADQLFRGQAGNIANQQAFQQLQLQGSQNLFARDMARRQLNAQLLGIQAGVPVQGHGAGFQQFGQAVGDIGQLMALLPMLRGASGT